MTQLKTAFTFIQSSLHCIWRLISLHTFTGNQIHGPGVASTIIKDFWWDTVSVFSHFWSLQGASLLFHGKEQLEYPALLLVRILKNVTWVWSDMKESNWWQKFVPAEPLVLWTQTCSDTDVLYLSYKAEGVICVIGVGCIFTQASADDASDKSDVYKVP